jgi:hypothetical protein
MPYLEPLKKGTPQPKVRRLKPTQPKVRRLKLHTRDRFRKGRGR